MTLEFNMGFRFQPLKNWGLQSQPSPILKMVKACSLLTDLILHFKK